MSQKAIFLILVALAVVVVGGIFLVLGNQEHTFEGVLYQNPALAPEIHLPSGKGDFFLSDQKGKLVLLFFGYTSCPDICPSSMADMKKIVLGLDNDDAKRVEVVFITVDPERDTAERLESYVSLFNPQFWGLSGSIEELQPIWQAYGVVREVDRETESMAGYLINHTARIYLIDQEGRLLLTYGFGTPPDGILEDVEYLLAED